MIRGWWIMIRACGQAKRRPLAPLARRKDPMLMAMPVHTVHTGAWSACMAS